MQAVVCEGKGTDMDGYTLSISRCRSVLQGDWDGLKM